MARIPFVFLVVFLLTASAFGQTNSAVLQGIVSDPSGARVASAMVVVEDVNQATRREISTDAEGAFTFTNLNPRTYSVTVSLLASPPPRGDPHLLLPQRCKERVPGTEESAQWLASVWELS